MNDKVEHAVSPEEARVTELMLEQDLARANDSNDILAVLTLTTELFGDEPLDDWRIANMVEPYAKGLEERGLVSFAQRKNERKRVFEAGAVEMRLAIAAYKELAANKTKTCNRAACAYMATEIVAQRGKSKADKTVEARAKPLSSAKRAKAAKKGLMAIPKPRTSAIARAKKKAKAQENQTEAQAAEIVHGLIQQCLETEPLPAEFHVALLALRVEYINPLWSKPKADDDKAE